MTSIVLLSLVVSGPVGAKLDRYLTESKYEGAVLVAKDGQVLLQKGYGLADREKGRPWTDDTIVSIGSITKQFTAAAILKLESQGKLAVEDTIGKYWKDAPEDKRGITLHQLLTHTSGLASDFAGDYDPVGRDEYVKRIFASKLQTPPGAAYDYANSGYSLLAAVVEIVSGKPYETYLREQLLLPAGLRETGYTGPKWDPARVPVGYRDGKPWGTMFSKPWGPDGPYWALRGNGGIESTLSDLWAWSRALDGDAVLPAAERKKMFTPWVKEGPGADSSYGYGWAISKTDWGTTLVAHDGGNGIFSADFRRYVDDKIVVIAAASVSSKKAWRVTGPLARIAHGEEVAPDVPPTGPLPPLGAGAREDVVREWVTAFNTGDIEATRAFRAKWMTKREGGPTDEQRDNVTRRMFEDFGKLTVDGVIGTSAEEIGVRMIDKTGRKLRFRFGFNPDGKVAGIAIEPIE